jgi:hypothetical protein
MGGARTHTEIRSYVFDALMVLVALHGKMAPTARAFLPTCVPPLDVGHSRPHPLTCVHGSGRACTGRRLE